MDNHSKFRVLTVIARYIALTILLYPLGVICHELVGHGIVGVLVGGHITYIEILTFQVWPDFQRVGWHGLYGACGVDGIPTVTGWALMGLGGAMSTWCVAVIAIAMLWCRRWGRIMRPILIVLSLWWIDLATYTLPSWGLRRSIFWGQAEHSEPYEAAMKLGVSGPLFQFFVVTSSAVLLFALIHALRKVPNAKTATRASDRAKPQRAVAKRACRFF